MSESDLLVLAQVLDAAKQSSSVVGLVAAATLILGLVQLTKLEVVQRALNHRDLAPWRPLIAFTIGGLGSVATVIAQGTLVTLSMVTTTFIAGGLAGLTGVGAHQLFKQTPRIPPRKPLAEGSEPEPVVILEFTPTTTIRRYENKKTGAVFELHHKDGSTINDPMVRLYKPSTGEYVYRSSSSLAEDFLVI